MPLWSSRLPWVIGTVVNGTAGHVVCPGGVRNPSARSPDAAPGSPASTCRENTVSPAARTPGIPGTLPGFRTTSSTTPRQFALFDSLAGAGGDPYAFTQMTRPLNSADVKPRQDPPGAPVRSIVVKNWPVATFVTGSVDCPFAWKWPGRNPHGVPIGAFAAPLMKSLSGPGPFECVANAIFGTTRAAKSDRARTVNIFLIPPP